MPGNVKVTVKIDRPAIQRRLERLCMDDATMLQVHNLFAKMMDPYVPFLGGYLSGSGLAGVTSTGVRYSGPYAHRQYYLHNMMDDLAGITNRTREVHPKATSYWDKAMMMEQGDSFVAQVKKILVRRAKELRGYGRRR